MADTLVDAVDAEPVPPTERDPAAHAPAPEPAPEPPPEPAPEPPPEPAPPAPKPPATRLVSLIVLSIMVLAGITALSVWYFVLRYHPTARAHVPGGTNVAIRLEAADIVLFEPVREHLLPLALEGDTRAGVHGASKEASRADKLHDRTGVHLPMDVREIVIASMDGKSWVALFGGRIEPGRFVAGLAEVAKEEGWAGFHREGELVMGPSIAVGQADDGTIIVGTDRSIVEAALPATEEGAALGLPEEGAVTFVVGKPAWEAASGMASVTPRASVLGTIERGTGALVLGASPELVLRLEATKAADVPALEEGTRGLLADLGLALLLVPDVAGEKDAVRGASVGREGGVVVVRAPWPREGLDRGAVRLARALLGEEKGP